MPTREEILARYKEGADASSSEPQVGQSSLGVRPSREEVLARYTDKVTPSATPEVSPSFFDKVGAAYKERQANVEDALDRMLMDDSTDFHKPIQIGERRSISPANFAVEALGNTFGLMFDTAAAGVGSAATTLWEVLPKSWREMVGDEAAALMQSPLGSTLLEAIKEGGEYYDVLSAQYPNEMKQLEATLNIVGAVPSRLRAVLPSEVGKDVVPYGVKAIDKTGKQTWVDPDAMDWKTAGKRRINAPLQGTDKDLFHLIQDTSSRGRLNATKNTTDPKGILGKQQQLATKEELDVIDTLKQVKGVSGANTLQKNLNAVEAEIANLDKIIKKRLAANNIGFTFEEVFGGVKNSVDNLMKENPALFGSATDATLRAVPSNMMNQLELILRRNGTDALGLYNARQEFDRYFFKHIEAAYKENPAFSGINEAAVRIRRTLNDAVDMLDEGTKAQRQKSANLHTASKRIAPKAEKEANTIVGRALQRIGLHGGSTFSSGVFNAPFAAVALPIGGIIRGFEKVKKGAISGAFREKLGYTLTDIRSELLRISKKVKTPEGRAEINAELKMINTLIQMENQPDASDK